MEWENMKKLIRILWELFLILLCTFKSRSTTICKIYKAETTPPLSFMILLSRNKIKRNGCWTADCHFRAVLSRLATPECQTLSPPLPSTSPCPSWQLLAYRPIQRVMRKLTDRFLSSRWKKAQTSLWGTPLHSNDWDFSSFNGTGSSYYSY